VPIDLRRVVYAAVVFWSALLLLLVQPLLTKAILPWFGGSAGVWTTSMLFFQTTLLFGYCYAHLLNHRLSLHQQVTVHCILLAVSVLALPLNPSSIWKPTGGEDPSPKILGLLITASGLPYFLLATTSPLLQSWYSRAFQNRMPYRLFALSNLGSLVALLAYPVTIEPYLPVHAQLAAWSFGYVVFAAFCAGAAVLSWRNATTESTAERPEIMQALGWLALATCPSVLWLAVGNKLSQEVAAVPFLWILPLALYLLSFVLSFDGDGWYRPALFRWLVPLAWIGFVVVVSRRGDIKWSALGLCASLFVCCMFCHGELARLRPEPRMLTAYYLIIAAGGALGGFFVSIVAPRLFTDYLEFPVAILGTVLLALWLLYGFPAKRTWRVGGTAALATIAALTMQSNGLDQDVHLRNFYGTLRVFASGSHENAFKALYNGAIQHGIQFTHAGHSRTPTTYYGPASGAAIVLDELMKRGPVHVGVIGLGVGTMATYGRPGDRYRFYEINPDVVHLANAAFRFLRESHAATEVIQGDARLSLEREQPQEFDLLVVDAFSGDSIPVHLLTTEAMAQYFRHLKPGGAVAVHVTNNHLDLAPVVAKVASHHNARALLIHNSAEEQRRINSSSWVVVTRDADLPRKLEWLSSPIRTNSRLRLWTDDYSNLLFILK
jgi:spermidine synthase